MHSPKGTLKRVWNLISSPENPSFWHRWLFPTLFLPHYTLNTIWIFSLQVSKLEFNHQSIEIFQYKILTQKTSTEALANNRKLRQEILVCLFFFSFTLLTDLMNVYRQMMRERVLEKYYDLVATVSFLISMGLQSSFIYFPMSVNNFLNIFSSFSVVYGKNVIPDPSRVRI